jgi:hypothetical protein
MGRMNRLAIVCDDAISVGCESPSRAKIVVSGLEPDLVRKLAIELPMQSRTRSYAEAANPSIRGVMSVVIYPTSPSGLRREIRIRGILIRARKRSEFAPLTGPSVATNLFRRYMISPDLPSKGARRRRIHQMHECSADISLTAIGRRRVHAPNEDCHVPA